MVRLGNFSNLSDQVPPLATSSTNDPIVAM
jgi:hypothetical protein